MEDKAPPPEESQAQLRPFDVHRSFEQRGNSSRGLTRKHIDSPAVKSSLVIQGRTFQHAQLHRPQDLSTFPPVINNIVLTCPDTADDSLTIKRRIPQRRKLLQDVYTFTPSPPPTQLPWPSPYPLLCLHCKRPKDPAQRCDNCGSAPTQRPPIRLTPILNTALNQRGLNQVQSQGLNQSQVQNSAQSFYRATPPPPPTTTTTTLPQRVTRAQRLNDPIVLSSDEDEDPNPGSSRLDSVSPRPADSAHSSPSPAPSSTGKVEAAERSVKGTTGESAKSTAQLERPNNGDFDFEDVNLHISIPRPGHLNAKNIESLPRRARMKDQFGNDPPEPKQKKPKLPSRCSSIILECRSMRMGSLRRVLRRPVVFTTSDIHIHTDGPCGVQESISLRTSELISCEWCSVRKLPVLFFQSSEAECQRLRDILHMSRDAAAGGGGGDWLDCNSEHPDERYIVLIFENGLPMEQQVILEDILTEIGQNNNLDDFPSKITFDEANLRLVNYNKASTRKDDKVSLSSAPPPRPSPVLRPGPVLRAGPVLSRTRMSTRLKPNPDQSQTRPETETRDFDSDEELNDLQPTFTGPVLKLMVYPPPPATGGITVTNEDLHCLNDGEFLNDVIIDFYLKYLVLEKLKKEESQRIHIFSSFFYKRLNQRERRSGSDASLPIQKRKHNRVKTWTRHVDLFQKDFIFVPINESAHWYLAVICFPGLDSPVVEPNPAFQQQGAAESRESQREEEEPLTTEEEEPLEEEEEEEEEPSSEHCRPLSPSPSPPDPEEGGESEENGLGNSLEQEHRQSFSNELQRISVCYGSSRDDDPFSFSDHSSCQDEVSEDGADDVANEASSLSCSATVCRQPCILIMDSLRGPTRSTVVKTLREYLEVEWQVRRGSHRSFHKELLRGSSPRVPQQDNFSDCGVYVLQYVESFFTKPIVSFQLPLNLSDWFPPQRMKTKREEIRELILRLSELQQQNHTAPSASPNEDSNVNSSSEPEIQE